jgi:hypothetical protein
MNSAVLKLQEEALSRDISVSDLLRKALVISKKLSLSDFQQWTQLELSGYKGISVVPEYRVVSGGVKFWNPYNGWCPVIFSDPSFAHKYSHRQSGQSIPELEHLLSETGDSPLYIPFPEELERALMKCTDIPFETKASLFTPRTEIVRIVDQVRTIILNWSLKLEEEGILGEGLFFNMSEKAAAASAPQNINNFYGPVQNPQIQQGNNSAYQTSSSIDSEILSALMQKLSDSLRDLNLNQDDQSEIIADVETVRTQLASPRPKNAIIGSCTSSIRSILEKAGGSAAGSLLAEFAKSTFFY